MSGKAINVEGQFAYVNPGEWFERQPARIGQFPNGWFVISHHWIVGEDGHGKPERQKLHSEWCAIKSGKGKIFRAIRFSPVLKCDLNGASGEIVLDWGGWLALSGFAGDETQPQCLEIRRANWWEVVWNAGRSHPDPAMRQAAIIALIAGGLGLLSVVISIIGCLR